MSRAAILASGYVTYPNDSLVVKPFLINDYVKYVLIKDYLRTHSNYFYSGEVENLYNITLENNSRSNDIDIRMRIIREAKELFDGRSILDWIKLQEHNPLKTITHLEYIKETLDFIINGVTRRTEVALWIRLIAPDLVNKNNMININRYLDEIIMKFRDVDNMSLNDLLCQWLNKPNGYLDLLNTLYIFYGPRAEMSTVT